MSLIKSYDYLGNLNYMKTKLIQVRLDEETHRTLKSRAVLAAQNLPNFTSDIITQALKDKKVFTK